jgi:hypothetical protein
MKLLELIILRFLGVGFRISSDNKLYDFSYILVLISLQLPLEDIQLVDSSNKEIDLVWVDFIGMPNSKNLLIYTKATGLIYDNLELTDKFKFIDVDNFIKHQKQLWGVQ